MNCTIRHCHRLDMDTTGCLIYAKDLITQSAMEQLFEENKFLKNYLAIVEGNVVEMGENGPKQFVKLYLIIKIFLCLR